MPVLWWKSGYCRIRGWHKKMDGCFKSARGNECTCRVFMESGEYWFDCPEKDKEGIKANLIEAWNKRYKED